MNVYIDNVILHKFINKSCVIYENLQEFLSSNGPKIAVFHAPFPRHKDFDHLSDIVDQIYDSCQSIIITVSELHDITVDFIQEHDHRKITYFLNGQINFQLKYAKVSKWFSWFESTSNFYINNLFLLEQLRPFDAKSKYFDILLGQKRPHRTCIYDEIINQKLVDNCILTYIKTLHQPFQERDNSEWIWETQGVVIPDWPMRHTVLKVKYYDQLISLSQIIPLEIYNQTAYSLVAETWGTDNRFTFNTEKIVKPILAERLFLVASNQYYLRNLRNLGFKTFDNIIDESYDSESDYKKRCAMIVDQMKYLMFLPQQQIFEKILSIVKHNKQVMLETDWHGDFAREFQAVLLDLPEQN
jgi:hypothetical protein